MRPEHSLRARFLWALAAVIAVMSLAFAFALSHFVEVLEQELLRRVVQIELQEMAEFAIPAIKSNSGRGGGLRRWTVRVDQQALLPEPLHHMREGVREIKWDDGTEVFAGKKIVGTQVFAVAAEIGDIERLERQLVFLGAVVLVLTILAAGWIATKLTSTALRPITDLVAALGKLDPTEPHPLYDGKVRTVEARLIARSIDAYQLRIASLLEREKSLTDDISHQLRTPTSVVGTAAELLLDDPTIDGLSRQRVLRVSRAARRMDDIVEAILFLGRGNAAVPDVKIDFRTVVREAVDDYRPVAQAKGLEVHAELADEQWVRAPTGLPGIIVQNLLENAIRFTNSGIVHIVLEPGRLVVEDTGIGLASIDKASIFLRGYRGDTSSGSGLGLDLIQRICDRLGWQVSAHDRLGGGTKFVVLWTSAAP